MTQFQMCPAHPRNQRRNPFAVHRTFSGTPPNTDDADAYEHILTIQNAADLEFPATDPANAPARANSNWASSRRIITSRPPRQRRHQPRHQRSEPIIKQTMKTVACIGLLLFFSNMSSFATLTANNGTQYRADTGTAIAEGGTIPTGVGVYFDCYATDTTGATIQMQVELQKTLTFTGTPNYTSSYVTSGSRPRTSTATGLTAGNYYWRYRVVNSSGVIGNWVAAGNPDFIVQAVSQPPTHGVASQVRADTGVAMADPGGTLPQGVGVYFKVTPTDPQGNTVRMEVELHQLPATFTGTANYVSSYVASGAVATTPTVTGLAPGNYGWAYRVVDSQGLASSWVAANNPDFTVQASQPPTHGIANQVRADTGVAMADPATIPQGVGVYFRVTPTDPQGNTVRMEVEWHQLPASFTGTANLVSSYVSSGSQATTPTLTGLAVGNYGWAYRVVDSQGLASSWVGANNPDFIVQSTTPILSVNTTSTSVSASAGNTSFNVSNTGGGTMSYSASVSSDSTWLTITSGGSGGNSGTINVSYPANNGAQRSGTIVVTASGASGSPITLTITQAAASSGSPFQIGNRVMAAPAAGVDGIFVRSAPPALTRIPGSDKDYDQSPGVHGTIVGGPSTGTAGGFTGNWWQINWDAGINGWSAESVIALAPLAGDVSEPNFSSSYYTTANIFWQGGYAPASTSPPTPQLGGALGNCTWYAYGRMLELGYNVTQLNVLHGDASEWDDEAIAAGITVDTTPTLHSIAQSDSEDHVAVIESINSDGTITVTESSYTTDSSSPWNILWRHRTVSPSWFSKFIHVSKNSTAPAPVITGISPTSMPADNNLHSFKVYGSNFDTTSSHLLFTDPYGNPYTSASHSAYENRVSTSEFDYQIDNADTAGTWTVKVNNPDGQSSATTNFTVTSGTSSTIEGIDYRDSGATATSGVNISGIVAAGKQFVCEYIGTADSDGYLRPADVTALTSQGLEIVSIFERNPTYTSYFTVSQADSDAGVAIAAAIEAGQPSGSAIYFTVDYAADSTALPAIDSYFQEIHNYFNQYFSTHTGISYKIGVYAPGNVLPTIMSDANVGASYSWLAEPWGIYSYSSENLAQTQNGVTVAGMVVDLDEAYTTDFGQWGNSGGGGGSAPVISNAKLTGSTFTLSVPTQTGTNYVLQYKNSISDANWIPIQTNSGTGGMMNLTNTGTVGPSRFYRIRLQ